MELSPKALVIDAQPESRLALARTLARDGFAVESTGDPGAAAGATDGAYDLIVLDLELPNVCGPEVLRDLRAASPVPIVVVTALDSEAEKIRGLELGADDYITKPFSPAELISRVHALRRRCELDRSLAGPVLRAGGVEIDLARHSVTVDRRPVYLTNAQFKLLSLLAERAGTVVSRREMMERLWNGSAVGDEHVCDVHISNIRQKIERDPSHPVRLVTVRGEGYRLSTS